MDRPLRSHRLPDFDDVRQRSAHRYRRPLVPSRHDGQDLGAGPLDPGLGQTIEPGFGDHGALPVGELGLRAFDAALIELFWDGVSTLTGMRDPSGDWISQRAAALIDSFGSPAVKVPESTSLHIRAYPEVDPV